ncbi:MAG: heavy-metal-associated domain-containing protein [Turicibacter sp.]
MAKTFMLSIENLSTEEDVKKIENYFNDHIEGVEKIEVSVSMKLVTVRYNESIGSPKYILDALNRLGYSVR